VAVELRLGSEAGRVRGMSAPGHCKCRHCREFFPPDLRNRYHQRYCAKPECRAASKRASQRQWESRPENRDYNRSAEKAAKVRAWQASNPGYWKRRRGKKSVLPDLCLAQPSKGQGDKGKAMRGVLPELLTAQPPVVIGLIAQMTGSVLPEDIAAMTGRLIARGRALMGSST
jgi:hypothetical protein